jgi:hypothetical protein
VPDQYETDGANVALVGDIWRYGRMIVVFSMHCDKRLSEDGEFVNLVRKH